MPLNFFLLRTGGPALSRLRRRARFSCRLAAGLLAFDSAEAQPASPDPVWRLTFGLSGSASSDGGGEVISFADEFTGEMPVRPDPRPDGVTWFPHGDGFTISGHVQQEQRVTAHLQGEGGTTAIERRVETYSGALTCAAHLVNAMVTVRPDEQRYDIAFTVMADMASTMAIVQSTKVSEIEGAPSLGGGRRRDSAAEVPLDMGPSQWGLKVGYYMLPVSAQNLPLNSKDGTIVGSTQVPVPKPARWKGDWNIVIAASWRIGMRGEELKLEIAEPDGYATWLPTATAKGGAGTPLTVTARLRTLDDKTPSVKVKSFIWRLDGTSREPGVAMNYPADAKDTRFDADLDASGGSFERRRNHQELERTVRNEYSDTVQVVPFDFGAWTTVQVTAVLEDGRRVSGRRKGSDEPGLRVPKRAARAKIADHWRDRHGVTDDAADDDETPVGDGNRGDGFSNYEEYRGFFEAGSHIRTKPKQKDFFIKNRASPRVLPGIHRFVDTTQLAAHYELRADEMPESRAMNANRTIDAPRSSGALQHGVVLELVHGGNASFNRFVSVLQPQRPGNVEVIRILSDLLSPDSETELIATVAHELAHSVGVPHHGNGDDFVAWMRKEREVGGKREVWFEERPADVRDGQWVFPSTPGTRIRIYDTKGAEIVAGTTDFLQSPEIIYLGHHQQQHSGDVACLMRYKNAQAFAVPTRRNDRFLSPGEPIGLDICTSAVGTEFNRPGLELVRYANARNGDCRGFLCVRDDAPMKRHVAR